MERGRRRHFALVLLVIACGASLAQAADEPKKPPVDDFELYQIFADTVDQIERNYVKDISRREIMEAAIQGVLAKLDPYSNYIKPDDINQFKTTVESQFGGIGIQIGMDAGRLRVISPIVGTPAYRAGLEAGDVILEIDGKSTEGYQSTEDAMKVLRGEAGSKVSLTVLHGTRERETLTITRELVHVDTVLGERRKEDGSWDFMLDTDKHIGLIRITAFSRDTTPDLERAIKDLQREGMQGLIIDLRNNPGGLLTTAIEVCDLFVASGRIVSTKGRNTPERVWDARKEGTYEGFPIAVLVNRYSASASEILSACLQDNGRAKVIGERTWGKGSVQNVIDLEGGKSALKLTTASYHRPNGKNIHRFPGAKEADEWGVMPDTGFEVKLSDMQLRQIDRNRRERDVVVPRRAKPATEQAAATPAADAAAPAKTEDEKPTEAKTDAPATQPNTETTKPEGAAEEAKAAPRREVVDQQLEKALGFLREELSQGTETAHATP